MSFHADNDLLAVSVLESLVLKNLNENSYLFIPWVSVLSIWTIRELRIGMWLLVCIRNTRGTKECATYTYMHGPAGVVLREN